MVSRMRGTSAMSTPGPRIMTILLFGNVALSHAQRTALKQARSEKIVAAVDDLPVDHPCFGEELVRARGAFSVDMKNFVAMSHQPVRDDHAMAAKINALGAHIHGA